MRKRNLFAAVLAVAVSLVLTATGASAHARYKESSPAIGEIISTAPVSVSITYTQDVQKISGTYDIAVTDANGSPITNGATTLSDADRARATVPLRNGLPLGRYVVRWENVSDSDGDPAEGAFSFYVGQPPSASDLIADLELVKVGVEEETPAMSPTTAPKPSATAQVATPAPSPVPTPADNANRGGGSNGSRIWIITAAATITALVTAFIVWRTVASRNG